MHIWLAILSILFPQTVFRNIPVPPQGRNPTITFVRMASSGPGGGTLTITYTTGDNVMVGCFDHHGAAYAPTDNITGNTYTAISSVISDPAAGISGQTFVAFNVVGGSSKTLNCNVTGGSNNYQVFDYEWHSTLSASVDKHCEGAANSGATPTSAPCTTTTQNNEFVAGMYWDAYGDSGLVTNPGASGYTWPTNSGCGLTTNCPVSTFYSYQSGYQITTATGSYPFTVNAAGSGHYVIFAAMFK